VPLDLSDTERVALVALLSATIAADRYPLSPRVGRYSAFSISWNRPCRCQSNTRRRSRQASRA